jgi:Holliday junction DNA helicase RuvA
LTTLPGIGGSGAEQIVATLKRKVTKYTVASATTPDASGIAVTRLEPQLVEDIYGALMGLGLSPTESRNRLDQLLQSGAKITGLQDAITAIFKKE